MRLLNNQRLNILYNKISSIGLDAMLITQLDNIFYLSGFRGSVGWLFVLEKKVILAVDFRYIEQAKNEMTAYLEIIEIRGNIESWLPALILDNGVHRIGFESTISYEIFIKIQEIFKPVVDEIKLIPESNIVELQRSVKDVSELEKLKTAAELTDKALEYGMNLLKPDISESKVAWEIEKFLRENDSENMPFDIIVASGPNSSMPHAKATNRQIKSGEPILIDLGAKINGYSSDLSRTFCLGKADETFIKVYDIVLGAQLTALALIESNMTGRQADSFARNVIQAANYGDYFGHGLGHGVGLAVHELPRLTMTSDDILVDSMVFTVEPGVYIPGWGGSELRTQLSWEMEKSTLLPDQKKL